MSHAENAPARRARNGPRGGGLNLDDLVRATLRLVREVGADRLTMRQLAEELGVTPMAAYHYVKSKDELLELAADAVTVAAKDASSGEMSWDEQLRANAHATFRAVSQYPGLGAFLLERPLSPAARASYRRTVQMLEAAGLSRRDAELAQGTFHTYMFGLLGMESRFRPLKRRHRSGSAPDAILVDIGVDEFIDFGIDLLVDGIRRRMGRPAD